MCLVDVERVFAPIESVVSVSTLCILLLVLCRHKLLGLAANWLLNLGNNAIMSVKLSCLLCFDVWYDAV